LAGPGDRRADAAEVEPGAYLLGRLVDRVVNLLAIELGDDVKGRLLCCHGSKARRDKREPSRRTRHVLRSAAYAYPAYRAVSSWAILAMPPALRHTAGCPSGQRERSVKPSAQPTLVRTQHLPPPGKTAPLAAETRPGGPFSSCRGMYQDVSLRV